LKFELEHYLRFVAWSLEFIFNGYQSRPPTANYYLSFSKPFVNPAGAPLLAQMTPLLAPVIFG